MYVRRRARRSTSTLEVKVTRRLLVAAIVAMSGIAAIVLAIVLINSLGVNGRSRAALYTIDLSRLPVGTYLKIDRPRARIYVERLPPDEILALVIPLSNGAVVLPDGLWWRPAGFCYDFGPDAAGANLAPSGKYRCRDRTVGDISMREWMWEFDGRFVGPPGYTPVDFDRVTVFRTPTSVQLKFPTDF